MHVPQGGSQSPSRHLGSELTQMEMFQELPQPVTGSPEQQCMEPLPQSLDGGGLIPIPGDVLDPTTDS